MTSLSFSMIARRLFVVLGVLSAASAGGAAADQPPIRLEPWAVYYAKSAPVEQLKRFRMLILDNENHAPLAPLLGPDRIVLGYLSVGEVGSHRNYFDEVKKQGLVLIENENWKGSFMVDVRKRAWTKRVVDELVPSILNQGFNGVFLDTLDNPGHLERLDPKKYKGMRLAGVELVAAIRRRYPGILIMMNRGYDLLGEISPHLDMVLGESVYSTYNFREKRYHLVDPEQYRQQLALLRNAQSRNPRLAVYTLDYWDPRDAAGRRRIYTEERKNGFLPYVATIQLDRIVEE